MTQHFIPLRKLGVSGSGRFGSKLGGYQKAVKVWLCARCRHWHDGRTGGKPELCAMCRNESLLMCDSAGEAKRYLYLLGRQDRGEIVGLEHHPVFALTAQSGNTNEPQYVCSYEADAQYFDVSTGDNVVEDFKPRSRRAYSDAFQIKRRWFEVLYGIPVTVVTKT